MKTVFTLSIILFLIFTFMVDALISFMISAVFLIYSIIVICAFRYLTLPAKLEKLLPYRIIDGDLDLRRITAVDIFIKFN